MRKGVVLLSTLFLFGMAVSAFAGVIDLTDTSATSPSIYDWNTASDGSLWRVSKGDPAGSGVYDPFMRYSQYPTSTSGIDVGMNSDVLAYGDQPPAGPTKDTHAVLFSTMGTTNVGGTNYWTFAVDFNEPGAATRFLSFDQYDIYQGAVPNLTIHPAAGDLIFNSLDTILTDFTLGKAGGSGWYDIEFLVPVKPTTLPYMYLYLENGQYVGGGKDWTATDGYEEVHYLSGTTTVPEPGTLLLLGFGLVGLVGMSRFKK